MNSDMRWKSATAEVGAKHLQVRFLATIVSPRQMLRPYCNPHDQAIAINLKELGYGG